MGALPVGVNVPRVIETLAAGSDSFAEDTGGR
jgi:hypothetical protein